MKENHPSTSEYIQFQVCKKRKEMATIARVNDASLNLMLALFPAVMSLSVAAFVLNPGNNLEKPAVALDVLFISAYLFRYFNSRSYASLQSEVRNLEARITERKPRGDKRSR